MKQISLNFGAVRDSVLRHAGKEIVAENGAKTTVLNSFLKSLKENPALKIQYLVFKNIEDGNFKKERLAERYLAQNLKLLESISWEKVLEGNRSARVSLLENSHVEGNKGKEQLYEHIHTLVESATRKSFVDLDRAQEAYDAVLTHLTLEKPEQKVENLEENDNPKLLSWNFVTKLAVNNFNERYSHLNEEEKNLLGILLSSEDKKKNHLDDLKKENEELIDSILSEGVKDKETEDALNRFKEKLKTITESSGGIDEAIINCAELKDALSEMRN
jgi:hypothetical protein